MRALDLDQLLDVPNLPLLLQQAQVALRDENARRLEFYDWLKEDVKAEFINGEIIMHSPVKERHWTTVGNIYTLLRTYVLKNKLGRVASEKALISLTRNDYEPDICFWSQDKAQYFRSEQVQLPAPDLIVEVLSRGTASRDRGVKYQDYEAHGVREYWLVAPGKRTVEQYVLDDELGQYEQIGTFTIKDEVESRAVPNFRIPVRALFDEEVNILALNSLVVS